jgi:hypothetical protein
MDNPSAGSVEVSAILGGTANRDTPKNIPQRKIKRDWKNE